MDLLCEMPPVPPTTIIFVDSFSNERKLEPFSDYPDSFRYKPRLIDCKDGERKVMVPVAEVRTSSMNEIGQKVNAKEAKNLLVEFFDKDGNLLMSTRMTKQGK